MSFSGLSRGFDYAYAGPSPVPIITTMIRRSSHLCNLWCSSRAFAVRYAPVLALVIHGFLALPTALLVDRCPRPSSSSVDRVEWEGDVFAVLRPFAHVGCLV